MHRLLQLYKRFEVVSSFWSLTSRLILSSAVIAAFFLILSPAAANAASVSVMIATDLPDYAPHDTVYITGSGFWGSEQVRVKVGYVNPEVHGTVGMDPWIVNASSAGGISTYWIVPQEAVGESLYVQVLGLSSGLQATAYFTDANSVLTITGNIGARCYGDTTLVCANLVQKCGGNSTAPLANRLILFFLDNGDCGANQGQVAFDSSYTNASGDACALLVIPATPGTYTLRVKYRGEDKPSPCPNPGNSACDPTDSDPNNRCVSISNSNDCEPFDVTTHCCDNHTPTITFGADQSVSQCTSTQICASYTVTDADGTGGIVESLVSGPSGAVINTAANTVCFTPASSGTYTVIVSAVDSCGAFDRDTIVYTVTINSPPVLTFGSDTTLTQCTASSICVTYGVTDPNGLTGHVESIVSAPAGATINTSTNQVCFTPGASGTFTVIAKVVDPCGAEDRDTINVNVTINSPPVLAFGADTTLSQCTASSICVTYTVTDPNGLTGHVESIVSAPAGATINTSTNQVCFTPGASGTFTVIAKVVDPCSAEDRDTININVTVNSPPVLAFGADTTLAQCSPSSICVTYSVTDPNGLTGHVESIVSAPPGATINTTTNQVCFTPAGTGTFTVIAKVVDPCGAEDRDTININVTTNSPPVLAFGADTTLTQCTGSPICVTYTVTDPDGLTGHVESIVSAPAGATINTSTNQVCFTPGASGTFTVIAKVVDPCSAEDRDTININVTLNSPPVLAFGADTTLFQCTASSICVTYSVTDPNGLTGHVESIVSAPPGATINTSTNQVCFTPGASGSYTVIAKVVDPCSAEDRDTININVTLNSAPVLAFGADTTLFQCTASSICVTYSVTDADGLTGHVESIVSAPPGATINTATNQVCFTPGASGTFTVITKVVDPCSAEDRDTININVTLNSPPVLAFGADTTLFQCTASSICVTYSVTDPNGLTGHVESIVSAPPGATINTTTNQVCFTPSGSGSYTVIAKVVDPCSAEDRDTININVTLNSPPVLAFGADTTLFQCTGSSICVTYSVTDPDGLTGHVESIVSAPPGATINTATNQVCFTPGASGTYTVITKVVDPCSAEDRDTININVTLNSPPVMAFGADYSVTQCTAAQICAPYTVSDPNGMAGLVETLVSGPAGATIDTAGNQVCFTPAASGTYTIIGKVADACGAYKKDTIVITVTVNLAPTIALGNDTTISQCTAAQICMPYTVSDPNGMAGLVETLVSGPVGATIDTSANNVCFTPAASGTYTIITKVTDACGALDKDTVVVTVTVNVAPTIAFGADYSVPQCTAAQICTPYTVSDPNGMAGLVETLVSGPAGATIDTAGNQVCFTPAASGTYTIIAKVTDACGAYDKDTIVITVTVNLAPTIALGNDTSISQCTAAQICTPYTVSDPNGMAGLVETLVSGPAGATIDTAGNQVCFTPAASGTYTIITKVADACAAYDKDTIVITVTVNLAPNIALGNDTSISQCTAAQICMPYTVSDPNGMAGLVETLVSGPAGATIDTAGNQVCFTPAASGTYTIITKVTDACGALDKDTVVVTVTVNVAPTIAFGADYSVPQCTAAQICTPYTVSDPNGMAGLIETLVTGPAGATIDTAGNQVCFTPAASGTYTIIAKVTDACGAYDKDTIVITVTVNLAPTIALGNDTSISQCTPAQICTPYAVSDPNGMAGLVETLVSGPSGASIDTALNKVCFTPAASGTFTIITKVADACGAFDKDTIVITVTINSPPVLAFGADTTLFQCIAASICVTYSVTDPDGLAGHIESIVSAPPGATINTGTNEVCFTPGASGSFTIIAKVVDPCGAEDRDTIKVNVTLNSPPNLAFGADVNVAQCTPSQICATYTVTDPDGLTGHVESIVSAPPGATINTGTNQVCFTPAGPGSYTIIAKVVDPCSAEDRDTIVINVTINNPPAIAFGADFNVDQCVPTQVCASYTASDPDGPAGLIESLVSGPPGANIDTALNKVCFTPAGPGTYTIIAKVADACSAEDRDTIVVTVNNSNQPPVVNFPTSPVNVDQCLAAQVCVPYTVTDAGPPPILEALISGPAGSSIDTVLNKVCFTPAGPGNYSIIVEATDACGAKGRDTAFINVTNSNQPPTIAFGSDFSNDQCSPTPICANYTVSDPNGPAGLLEALVSGPAGAAIDTLGNKVCFTPAGPGTYTIIAKVTDGCGIEDRDTVVVTVTNNNQPPIVNFPTSPVNVDQCIPAQVCVPYTATDASGPAPLHEALISGPTGTTIDTVNNQVCFTPAGVGNYQIIVEATDACGSKGRDTAIVNVTNSNQAPQIAFGADFSEEQCGPAQICATYTVSDPNGNSGLVEALVSGPAGSAINTTLNEVCFTPAGPGSYTIIVKVTDPCTLSDRDTIQITVTGIPQATCPPLPDTIFERVCEVAPVCVQLNSQYSCQVISGPGQVVNGVWCYTPPDMFDTVDVTIQCTSGCGSPCQTSFTVATFTDPMCDECPSICIDTLTAAPNSLASVCVTATGDGVPWGGFDFLFHYDPSMLALVEATPGQFLIDCDWEYFTYRLIGGTSTSGLVRVVAIADMNNSNDHPLCLTPGPGDVLLCLTFRVTNDWNLSCRDALIQWYWSDCGDNSVSNPSGDTLYIANGAPGSVVNFEGTDLTGSGVFGGPPLPCPSDKLVPQGCATFCGGKIKIICPGDIDDRGDINLNAIAYEISDAVLYSQYFISGPGVLVVNSLGQIAASDVNADGVTLTVADLVYLIRVITGDELPITDDLLSGGPKAATGGVTLSAESSAGHTTVSESSEFDIGAALFVFDAPGVTVTHVEPTARAQGMDVTYQVQGDQLRVLMYNIEDRAKVAAGSGPVLSIDYSGNTELKLIDVEAATFEGGALTTEITAKVLPAQFALHANHPNPFNPSTSFQVDFPTATDYTLVIYNITGQVVRTFQGSAAAGSTVLHWDGMSESGQPAASGVYFYQISAGPYHDVRKMVLMK